MTNKEMHKINKELIYLQNQLIDQLKTGSIEYIDLLSYYNKVEILKTKKNTLYLIMEPLH